MQVAERVANLPPYVFAQVGRRIRELESQGMDIIRLDIGSPDLPPPEFILEAMYRSAKDGAKHGYGGYYGIPALRAAMSTYYLRRFEVALDPDTQVAPLIGSKEGIVNTALAFIDPGSLALVPDPGYPTYTLGTLLAGGETYPVPLRPERDYLPDLDAIPVEIARAARILWLNYPNNPTGAVAPLSFFERAVAFGKRYDTLICHDNPYCDVTFDGYAAPSILEVPGAMDVALEFNSLSKAYNMAGWRVGMAVGNANAVQTLARTKTNIDSGIFLPIQDAAIVALTGEQEWLEGRNAIYRERRDLILGGLADLGIRARKSQASLYIWAETPEGYSSHDFATRLLEEAGISIGAGTIFGQHGEGYLRISLGMSTERISEAMGRLKRFVF